MSNTVCLYSALLTVNILAPSAFDVRVEREVENCLSWRAKVYRECELLLR